MVEIHGREELRDWLQGKPAEWGVVIAARAALRVLPVFGDVTLTESELDLSTFWPVLRAMAAAEGAAKYATPAAVRAAANAADAAPAALDAPAVAYAARAARAAARAAAHATDAVRAAALAAAYAARSARAAANVAPAFWKAVSFDATWLENGIKATQLAKKAIWLRPTLRSYEEVFGEIGQYRRDYDHSDLAAPFELGSPSVDLLYWWAKLKGRLLTLNENWDVWTDWYDRLLEGKRPLSKEIELYRVTLDSEEDWKTLSPKEINAKIKAKIEGRTVAKPAKAKTETGRSTKRRAPATGSSAKKARAANPTMFRRNATPIAQLCKGVKDFSAAKIEELEARIADGANDREPIQAEIDRLKGLADAAEAVENLADGPTKEMTDKAITSKTGVFSESLEKFWNAHSDECLGKTFKVGLIGFITVIAGLAGGGMFATVLGTSVAVGVVADVDPIKMAKVGFDGAARIAKSIRG